MNQEHILLISADSQSILYINAQTRTQREIAYQLPAGTIPLSYDGKCLVLNKKKRLGRQISILSVEYSEESDKEKDEDELSFKEYCTISVSDSKRSYWGFIVSPSGQYIVVVSKLSKFSVFSSKGVKIRSFDSFCKSIVGFVLRESSAESEESEGILEIIGICNDRSCRMWRDGKLIWKINAIDGTFTLGYPYVLRLSCNGLFYSSDIGIHYLSL